MTQAMQLPDMKGEGTGVEAPEKETLRVTGSRWSLSGVTRPLVAACLRASFSAGHSHATSSGAKKAAKHASRLRSPAWRVPATTLGSPSCMLGRSHNKNTVRVYHCKPDKR